MRVNAIISVIPVKKYGRPISRRIKTILPAKCILVVVFVLFGVFLAVNLAVFAIFRGKTYPNTYLNGNKIGNVRLSELDNTIEAIKPIYNSYKINLGDKNVVVKPDEMGLVLNYQETANRISSNRYWIPVINLLAKRQHTIEFDLHEARFIALIESKAAELEKEPRKSYIAKDGDKFTLIEGVNGVRVDYNESYKSALNDLGSGTDINLAANEVKPEAPKIDLLIEQKELNIILDTKINLVYQDKKIQLTKEQILEMLQPDGESYVPSISQVGTVADRVIHKLGIKPNNRNAVIENIKTAIIKAKDTEITVEPKPVYAPVYSYCVAAKGVPEASLGEFSAKLASVYSDARGWGMGGKVTFAAVNSGCSFTAWLTAAELVPSFNPSVCDSTWSCRVGNNVIINFARWSGASPAWNVAGGSLDDYRSMVINHETGHWFGFNHRFCGGSGQPAPVMQQQSISLQGCAFNPWPTASELQSLTSQLGL